MPIKIFWKSLLMRLGMDKEPIDYGTRQVDDAKSQYEDVVHEHRSVVNRIIYADGQAWNSVRRRRRK